MASSQTFAKFLLLSIGILTARMANGGVIAPSLGSSRNLFSADLFNAITSDKTEENIVFSPLSIQSCSTLLFFGAEGKTAEELRNGLHLGSNTPKTDIAQEYGDFVKATFKRDNTDGPKLKLANRIYVNEGLEIAPEFQEIATKYFDSKAEAVNFDDSTKTVEKINAWVEQQTENKIKNLLAPTDVDAGTSSVLVNAIYFKGDWAEPFGTGMTDERDFTMANNAKVTVKMMYQSEDFKYAELPEIDAKALEMPFKNSDISMLILLPNKVDGLKNLETKLAGTDLNEIAGKLKMENVDVSMPKFKIEYDVDLKKPLQKLGMSTMFSDSADLTSLFASHSPQKVDEAKHKAYIDVNEQGVEAAAVTRFKIMPMSLNMNQKTFRADHPFLFAIRSHSAVYFVGHVAKF